MVATSLIVWPVAPVFLLMHGEDVTFHKGTEVMAYISGDVKLDLAKFQPSPLVPASPPVPATQQVSPHHQPRLRTPGPPTPSCIAGPRGCRGIGGVLDSRWRRHRDWWQFRGQHTFHDGSCGRPHQLSVKKAGFKPWERTITVSSGHIKIDATLESQTNERRCSSCACPAKKPEELRCRKNL